MDVVLGAWSNWRDWEGHVAGPHGAWACSGGSLVKLLIVDLGSEEEALELELSNLDWVGCDSSHVEDTVGVELGRVRNTLGLVHEDLEVLHSCGLDEGEGSGHAWEWSSPNTCWLVEHLLGGSKSDESGVCKLHLYI